MANDLNYPLMRECDINEWVNCPVEPGYYWVKNKTPATVRNRRLAYFNDWRIIEVCFTDDRNEAYRYQNRQKFYVTQRVRSWHINVLGGPQAQFGVYSDDWLEQQVLLKRIKSPT
jgi:hypothetical protein